MRKFIISTITLASLASITLLSATGPVAAAKMTCTQKYNQCGRHCAAQYKDYPTCIYRTCDKLYDRCAGAAGLAAKSVRPDGGVGAGPKPPTNGGIGAGPSRRPTAAGKPTPKGPVVGKPTGTNGGIVPPIIKHSKR